MGIIPKNIKYLGVLFNIQAYLENDFVNLSPCQQSNIAFDSQMWLIKIDFIKNKVSHQGKETKAMTDFISQLNIEEIKEVIQNEMSIHEKLKELNFPSESKKRKESSLTLFD